MSRVAVFVDAGYFWVQAGIVVHGPRTPGTPRIRREDIQINYASMRQEVLAQVAAQFPNGELLRVYWYDGPGPNGVKAASHLAIEDLDDFKLRLGTRNGAGDQKAVDGLIIADLIGLTQNKAISGAILLSGDADLTPGVIAAQGLGLRVHLLSMGPSNATSPHLRAEVDFKSHWADAEVQKFAARTPVALPAPAAPALSAPAPAPTPPRPAPAATPPATEAPATPAPAVDATLSEVAHEVFAALDPAKPVAVSSTGLLPNRVDQKLLAGARIKLGRVLVEREKIAMREEFKKLLAAALSKNEPA
jgi:uncharacterized LabA/DUF88 family protein